jgi:hypothetical protein
MLNSEMEIGPGSDQYDFLSRTLQSIDRTVTPWTIVLFHRPIYYVDATKAGGVRNAHFATLEPILQASKVDLVLYGAYPLPHHLPRRRTCLAIESALACSRPPPLQATCTTPSLPRGPSTTASL